MTDVSTRFEDYELGDMIMRGDWQFQAPDLESDHGLETAVLISLFTDGLAGEDDELPDTQSDDRRGFWADTNAPEGPLGSKLWLLSREKQTPEVRERAEEYCREALEWLITDDVADLVTVDATWSERVRGMLMIEIGIYRAQQLVWSKSYPWVWAAVQAGMANVV